MMSSSIGQRTKCVMPNLPRCRMSLSLIEENPIGAALGIRLILSILDERERHNATTTKTHPNVPGGQDLSLCVGHRVPGIYGCICQFPLSSGLNSCHQ